MNIPSTDSAILQKIADRMGLQFSLNGISLNNEEVFSTDGALPLFYIAAASIAGEVELDGLDFNVDKDEQGLFELQARVGDKNHSVRLLLLVDALMGFVDSELLREDNNGRVIELTRLHTRLIEDQSHSVKMEF